jgi:hypothetical protein
VKQNKKVPCADAKTTFFLVELADFGNFFNFLFMLIIIVKTSYKTIGWIKN